MNRTITVQGVGRIAARADSVVLSVTLTARDKEYAAAAQSADEQARQLEEGLVRAGFAAETLKTESFNVNVEYENVRDETGVYRNVRKGFLCTRRMKLQFDFERERLAAALNALAGCPALPEFSVAFTVKDRETLHERALAAAAEDAKRRAKALLAAAGSKLGTLAEIRHGQDDRMPLSPTRLAAADGRAFAAAALAANVTPEDIDVCETAVFVWEIVD